MGGRLRVRTVYPFTPDDRALIAAAAPGIELVAEGADDPDWLAGVRDPDVEVLVASVLPADLAGMPRLRWVCTAAAGVEDLVAADPWAHGIEVTNGSGLHGVGIAEYVLAAVCLGSERIPARLANHAVAGWAGMSTVLNGRRMRGRHAVIVGYGSIGREIGRVLDALGIRITAVKRDPDRRTEDGWREPGTGDPEGRIPARWAGPGELADVVRDADWLICTAPATPGTRHLVDARVLAAMRPDAWLVSTGRGSVVDQAALDAALRSGRLGGAVLDVTTPEPLPPDHPLWGAPGCLITPHVSAIGDRDELWHRTALLVAEQLRRDRAGLPLLNRVSAAAGY